jgi:hypothetical protein
MFFNRSCSVLLPRFLEAFFRSHQQRNSNVDLWALRQKMLFSCCFIVIGPLTCRLSEAASWPPVYCQWWVGTARFCVQEGCFFPCKMTPYIFASLIWHQPPCLSPHRRINAPSLLLAFAHIQGEAGTPTGGVGSAVVGRNSPPGSVCRRGAFSV